MNDQTEQTIRDAFSGAIIESTEVDGALSLKIKPESLLSICEQLHAQGFDYLADITAIDWPEPPSVPPSQGGKIEVVYRMTALARNEKIVLRVDLVRANPEIESITSVYRSANYQEREIYDLMGVVFTGHPDLRRILTPEDWEGYPLRKDYAIPNQD